MCTPALASSPKAWSHSESAVIVIVTSHAAPRGGGQRAGDGGVVHLLVLHGQGVPGPVMTDRTDASALVGDHTRSVPSGGVMRVPGEVGVEGGDDGGARRPGRCR